MRVIALFVVSGLVSAGADAQVLTSTAEDTKAVAVTVYNDGTGLVREERVIRLPAGVHELRFEGVAQQIEAPTVSVGVVDGSPMRVLEQNYEYDLLSPRQLLEKFVGETLTLVRTVTENDTDVERSVAARLLATNEGTVWEIDGKIVSNPAFERIAFPYVPENLAARPTLVWLVDADGDGERRVETTYLTRGLGWQADYVLTLDDDDAGGSLRGWVTINNGSGATYEQAQLKLVAGDVNRVAPPAPRTPVGTVSAMAAPGMAQEEFFEYHLYSLPRPTTLKQNQTKQVQLLSAEGIVVGKRYELRGHGGYYRGPWNATSTDEKVRVLLTIRNDEASGLGQPLPKGTVRVYKRDRSGNPQFAGEDRIDHTPRDEDFDLSLGNAFDIVAERRQTDFDRVANDVTESAYEVRLRNHKSEAVMVEVVEPLGGDWTMLTSTLEFDQPSAFEARFIVEVPADGEAMLTYRVRTHF